MKALPILVILSTLYLSAHAKPRVTNPQKPPKNAVLLSTVQSLTLRAGKQTSSRRTSPVPQLTCVGPAHVCKLYNVDMMRCTNEGSDYEAENVQWACKSSLPEDFKLGSTDVGCEGYESSEDPFVLKGSCGVEYRLLLTEKGEEKFGLKNEKSFWGDGGEGGGLFSFVFMLAFVGVLVLIAWSCIQSVREGNDPNLGVNSGGGGRWGGGGGGDDPPPPYDPYPDSRPPKKPSTRTYTPRSNTGSSSRTGQAQGEQWRPGFWTGAAAGAAGATAANYLTGNRNRTQAHTQPETRQTGGGMFGGWGGGSTRPSGSGGGSSSSSGSPSYSSSRHTSTGFGGTSRR